MALASQGPSPTFWRDMCQRVGLSLYPSADEDDAKDVFTRWNQAQAQYQRGLQAPQYFAQGIGGIAAQGLGTSVSPPPTIKRNPIKPISHTMVGPDLEGVGKDLCNRLVERLPLKLRLLVHRVVFETTYDDDTHQQTDPRITVQFYDQKTVTFPIDDEDAWMGDDCSEGQWSKDAVIARLAIEAP